MADVRLGGGSRERCDGERRGLESMARAAVSHDMRVASHAQAWPRRNPSEQRRRSLRSRHRPAAVAHVCDVHEPCAEAGKLPHRRRAAVHVHPFVVGDNLRRVSDASEQRASKCAHLPHERYATHLRSAEQRAVRRHSAGAAPQNARCKQAFTSCRLGAHGAVPRRHLRDEIHVCDCGECRNRASSVLS